MSTSAQEAAQELRKCLIDLLQDQQRPYCLNERLAKHLKSCRFPETPRKFDDACVFFREFLRGFLIQTSRAMGIQEDQLFLQISFLQSKILEVDCKFFEGLSSKQPKSIANTRLFLRSCARLSINQWVIMIVSILRIAETFC